MTDVDSVKRVLDRLESGVVDDPEELLFWLATDGVEVLREWFQMKAPSLKPCPFCGSEPELLSHESEGWAQRYWVECRECGATLRSLSSRQRALDYWNMRR